MIQVSVNQVIRKATPDDIDSVCRIYSMIHGLEKSGVVSIGWNPDVYPTKTTAVTALESDSLFVMTIDGEVIASAIINHEQPGAYSLVDWEYAAEENRVGILHTLVVHPDFGNRGFGKIFVSFFEEYCRTGGCDVVRLDTQVKNTRPFALYPKLGYRLAGIRETEFQNLPGKINLAMFEKKL